MATLSQIRTVGSQIGEAFDADKVILFGSHSRGQAGVNSYVDLLVVMPVQGAPFRQAAKILSATRAPFPLDVIVRSPRSVRQRLAMGDCFMRDVIEKGVVVYEAPAPRGRVGRKGRGRLSRHATRTAKSS
jgi:predicted nucleotidyltransferase